jgi:hypothetical protein
MIRIKAIYFLLIFSFISSVSSFAQRSDYVTETRYDNIDTLRGDVYYKEIQEQVADFIDSISLNNYSQVLILAHLGLFENTVSHVILIGFNSEEVDLYSCSKGYGENDVVIKYKSFSYDSSLIRYKDFFREIHGHYLQKYLSKKEYRQEGYRNIIFIKHILDSQANFSFVAVNKRAYGNKNDDLPPESLRTILQQMAIYYDSN